MSRQIPRIPHQQKYDLSYLNKIFKYHDYGAGEIRRMHFLGSFTSHEGTDELTAYLHYLNKLTTVVNIIYDYNKYLHGFIAHSSYNSQPRNYCKYGQNTCGFVQIVFGENRKISKHWEQNTLLKLYNSPELPYFVVYISTYDTGAISAGKAKYFYTFMAIGGSPIHLYVVTNSNFSQTTAVLNIACLSCKGYKDMLVKAPDDASGTLKTTWEKVHKNSNLAYLSSNFFTKMHHAVLTPAFVQHKLLI